MEPSHQKVISFAAIALIVLVSSFTNWVSAPGPVPGGTANFVAWNSYLTLSGFSVQNWLVVFIALGIVLTIGLKEYSIWKPSKWVPIGLSIYGLAHSALAIFLSFTTTDRVWMGPILSLIAFILFIILISRDPELKVL